MIQWEAKEFSCRCMALDVEVAFIFIGYGRFCKSTPAFFTPRCLVEYRVYSHFGFWSRILRSKEASLNWFMWIFCFIFACQIVFADADSMRLESSCPIMARC